MDEKDKIVLDVSVADGKYRVLMTQDGKLRVLRHGEEWRDLTGDKLILCMAQEIEELRDDVDYLEGIRQQNKDNL